MIDRVNNEMGPTKRIGYYVYESGDYEQDLPVGCRETLIEAEALRHFVAENRSHSIRWEFQTPILDIWSWNIMPITIPIRRA